jgi:hypothetical protein
LLCVLVGGPQDNEGIKVWVTFSKIREDVHYFVKQRCLILLDPCNMLLRLFIIQFWQKRRRQNYQDQNTHVFGKDLLVVNNRLLGRCRTWWFFFLPSIGLEAGLNFGFTLVLTCICFDLSEWWFRTLIVGKLDFVHIYLLICILTHSILIALDGDTSYLKLFLIN